VKVALAGDTTMVLAVFLMLFEVAATGRLTTKNNDPNMVTTRQAGRTTTVSVTTASGPSLAKVLAVPAHIIAAAHSAIKARFFIVRSVAGLVLFVWILSAVSLLLRQRKSGVK
jgi:hypothetical protein